MSDQPPPYPGTEKGSSPPYSENPAYPPTGQQGYSSFPQNYSQPGYPQQPQPTAGYTYQPYPQTIQPQQPTYPQGGYPVNTQPVAAGTTVTILQTCYRDVPVETQCPNCNNHVTTQVTYDAGAMAWLMCFIMCLVGLWCCCCIPFCVDGLKDADHHCPNCKHRIAHYSPL